HHRHAGGPGMDQPGDRRPPGVVPPYGETVSFQCHEHPGHPAPAGPEKVHAALIFPQKSTRFALGNGYSQTKGNMLQSKILYTSAVRKPPRRKPYEKTIFEPALRPGALPGPAAHHGAGGNGGEYHLSGR